MSAESKLSALLKFLYHVDSYTFQCKN